MRHESRFRVFFAACFGPAADHQPSQKPAKLRFLGFSRGRIGTRPIRTFACPSRPPSRWLFAARTGTAPDPYPHVDPPRRDRGDGRRPSPLIMSFHNTLFLSNTFPVRTVVGH